MSQKKFNINELDFNNIGNWPQNAKVVFCVVLALFIVVMGYLLVFRGQQEELAGLERKEVELRADFEKEQGRAVNLEPLKQQLAQMEQVDARMTEVAEAVSDDAGRSEALEGEVHMLEDLVQRMGQRLEERVSASALHARYEPNPRRHHQSAALLDTVREALAENRVDLYLQPVVGLPQRRTVFYESYSRLRDASDATPYFSILLIHGQGRRP